MEASNKDMLSFFLQWLRENNFHKTESALYAEIQPKTENAAEPGEARELPHPFEPPCGAEKEVPQVVEAWEPNEDTEAASPTPLDEDEDEWTDADDLGYIRVPGHLGDTVTPAVPVGPSVAEVPPPAKTKSSAGEMRPAPDSALADGTSSADVALETAKVDDSENLGSGDRNSPEAVADETVETVDDVSVSGEPEPAAEDSKDSQSAELAGEARAHHEQLQQQYQVLQAQHQRLQQQLQQAQPSAAPPTPPTEAATAAPTEAPGNEAAPAPAPAAAAAPPVADSEAPPPASRKPQPVYEAFNLKVIYEVNKTGFEENKDYPIRVYDIIAGRYQILEYLGSAAFSRAVQCVDLKNGQLVCIKIIRNNKDFFDQGLDEIKLLHYINSGGNPDENRVVQLFDYFYHKEHLFLVCELLRDNLYEFSKYNRESGDEPYFTLARLQSIARQTLIALRYIHSLGLIHCDLKPENILIKSYSRCEIKVIDFGSSCFTTDHLSSYVQSRCYRAPEVILGLPYDYTIDLWSLGAILPELYNGRVLFHNESVPTMLARIVAICGDFPQHMIQGGRHSSKFFTEQGILYEYDKQTDQVSFLQPKRTKLRHRVGVNDALFLDFIAQLVSLDPRRRPTADEALRHPFLAHDYGPINPQ
eukprot:TRINITY_DN10074_c0_g1_i1.p1 TRINITY_DN10074_c0_g1~~TRINITY_DN10074_c0_g1_i1.p1  ORF type:complete len:658 (+),score=150.97 TRINITY_DN10074_c0_g1_i1:44-1975(+)